MKKFFKTSELLIVLTLTLGLVGSSIINNQPAMAADSKIRWKLQSHLPTATPSWEGAILPVCELLKVQTGGRLIIEPHPKGSIVPPSKIFNALSRGIFHMGTSVGGWFQYKVPLAGIADGLPFCFKKYNEVV